MHWLFSRNFSLAAMGENRCSSWEVRSRQPLLPPTHPSIVLVRRLQILWIPPSPDNNTMMNSGVDWNSRVHITPQGVHDPDRIVPQSGECTGAALELDVQSGCLLGVNSAVKCHYTLTLLTQPWKGSDDATMTILIWSPRPWTSRLSPFSWRSSSFTIWRWFELQIALR